MLRRNWTQSACFRSEGVRGQVATDSVDTRVYCCVCVRRILAPAGNWLSPGRPVFAQRINLLISSVVGYDLWAAHVPTDIAAHSPPSPPVQASDLILRMCWPPSSVKLKGAENRSVIMTYVRTQVLDLWCRPFAHCRCIEPPRVKTHSIRGRNREAWKYDERGRGLQTRRRQTSRSAMFADQVTLEVHCEKFARWFSIHFIHFKR